MTIENRIVSGAVVCVLVCASGASQGGTATPSRRELTQAVAHYLSDHGDICVGKFTWPRTVTEAERQAASNDAVQLPVLERLGLVAAVASPSATTYSLTPKGQRFYLQKKRMTLGPHDVPVEHDEDLCVATVKLDKVVNWSPPQQAHGHLETLVRYTYRVKAANWMADPQARTVFPVIDRIIRGQGNRLMSVTVQLQEGRWTPVLPGQ